MRRLWIGVAIVAVALGIAATDEDAGLRAWWRLRGELRVAEARVAELRSRVEAREDASDQLREEPLALEQAIRADLGWARPGDLVVVVPDSADASRTRRNP